MDTMTTTARAAHDLGPAAWCGGALMGGAAAHVVGGAVFIGVAKRLHS